MNAAAHTQQRSTDHAQGAALIEFLGTVFGRMIFGPVFRAIGRADASAALQRQLDSSGTPDVAALTAILHHHDPLRLAGSPEFGGLYDEFATLAIPRLDGCGSTHACAEQLREIASSMSSDVIFDSSRSRMRSVARRYRRMQQRAVEQAYRADGAR